VLKFKKRQFIAMVVLMLFIFFAVTTTAVAADRFTEIIYRFYQGFKHVGTVEHDHGFSADEGSVGFTALGQGLVGGSHHAWARKSSLQRTLNSAESYTAYTDRAAQIGQYMRIISGFELSRGHSGLSAIMLNPDAIGRINQTVSSSTEFGEGTYMKHSNRVQNDDGVTIIENSIGGSTTEIEVEGYTEYREVVIIERGGKKTGWWDLGF
jgi:hypothetical protein